MERRVKERLVGASILVVLIVLIVPELFSGPKAPTIATEAAAAGPAESHNVVVDMATSKATPTEESIDASAVPIDATTDSVASAASAAQAPTSDSAVAPSTASQPGEAPRSAPPTVVTLQAQQPAVATLEKTAPPPRSAAALKPAAPREAAPADASHHAWSVQIGSFASRVNAEKLQRNLKAQSYPASVLSGGSGKGLRFRVRVGPLADRAAADRMIARLKQEGHAASVVAP